MVQPEKRSRLKTSAEYKSLKLEKDLFRRRMLFLAFFANKLQQESNAEAILVGGQAIDLYSGGTFATSDIDLVVSNKAAAEKLLNRLGFGKQDAVWFNGDLNIVVQLTTRPYSGDTARLRRFKVRDFEFKVAAPEDLIVNRLYSLKFWRSNPQRDLEQAVLLLRIFSGSIDNNYLDDLGRKNEVEDYLAEARKYALKV